ncbi:hypothetical protein SALWKB2_1067 [Snodgrassella alvi wkB2]|nr:hypothetical protein SALWKB2_1067 [Snodgrassella alvi wkB2]
MFFDINGFHLVSPKIKSRFEINYCLEIAIYPAKISLSKLKIQPV